jgi:hypothetical protein
MTAITPFPICWSLTRRVGVVAYFLTWLGCLLAWIKVRRTGQRGRVARTILIVTLIELFFCMDMVFEWRLALHALGAGFFIERNLYADRHSIQAPLLVALAVLLCAGLAGVFRRFRGSPGLLIAVAGVAMSLTLWLVEIISMHETDAVLYYFIHGLMVIAFLWILACALTFAGAGMASVGGESTLRRGQ